jgi:hypothetical protein
VLMVLVQSVLRRLLNSLSHVEESMPRHVGVNGIYYKLGKRNTKGSMVGPGGSQKPRVCFFCSGAFKTYDNQ